ncbi:sigma-54 interaction domain-containing protein [Parerythrobacter jejuensis]|uniref:AAA domain-containing protein n=1 Tax=Parerythrobacter jejuensis TaxID=795812 RepID=A0A845AV40_9SPHN|nr:sigma 54-interacting transcriptional regulator [Parerythrobacter jejuensis]MXP30609.1 AAA domain-containing protein [Parerythrobacter jejuensis]MXP33369.1 AAA domain-containing protein [Parerythrobacter jejuensis]
MSQHFTTEDARKKHGALIDRVLPVMANPACGGALHLADCDERDVPHRREDRMVVMGRSDAPALVRMGPAKARLAYDAGDLHGASAALLAASTAAGMPIAGDTETLALLTLAERVAASTIPVLVEGPTGTGKEVLARYLHQASPRRDGPFVAVNCAAMPEAMLEALLFGHRKGAFTGASEAHEGFFRAADGGTLLLDEIGEMPIALQSKLLRALQEGEVVPLGATKPVQVDVRIVACTNRELPREVEEGRFREDLYYRLNVFPLSLRALRERPGDIAPLAFGMLLKHGEAGQGPRWIAPDAMDLLRAHAWPGNVRELENVIRRAILLASDGQQIEARHIRFDRPVRAVEALAETQGIPAHDASLSDIAFRSEADAILRTLNECGGKRGATARKLGISERTLRYRLADMRDAGLAIAGAGS